MAKHFRKEMMCGCGSTTFSMSPLVVTQKNGAWSIGTDTVLKCLSCLKDFIYAQGTTELCPVSQENGKTLVRTARHRLAPIPQIQTVSDTDKPTQEIFGD